MMVLNQVKAPDTSNKRSDNRLDICLAVEVTLASGQQIKLCTRNLSTTGVYLEKADHEMPPVGSIIHLKLNQKLGLGEAPLVKGKVVRTDEHGVGIQFIED